MAFILIKILRAKRAKRAKISDCIPEPFDVCQSGYGSRWSLCTFTFALLLQSESEYLKQSHSFQRSEIQRKNKSKSRVKTKNIQQQGFACGHPPYY